MRLIKIDPLSSTTVRLALYFHEQILSTATGFIVEVSGAQYLITNWHVVTGRDADTEECLSRTAGIPNRLVATMHALEGLGAWTQANIPLLGQDGKPIWLEHPQGRQVDVVAIPLSAFGPCASYPLDLGFADADIIVQPGMLACILGFPYGLGNALNWPIWKTGHVASDPDLDFAEGRPAFLIDASTRGGMSGAPVVLRISSGFETSGGAQIIGGPMRTKFLGVYAGRIHAESDVGRVWRPFTIKEVISGRLHFSAETCRESVARNSQCPCGRGQSFKNCCGSLISS